MHIKREVANGTMMIKHSLLPSSLPLSPLPSLTHAAATLSLFVAIVTGTEVLFQGAVTLAAGASRAGGKIADWGEGGRGGGEKERGRREGGE